MDKDLVHPKDGGEAINKGFKNATAGGQFSGKKKTPPEGTVPDWVLNTVSYYDYNEIPNYWEYARRYTLCDMFFSSLSGPSEPNHLYAIAAQSAGMVNNPKEDVNGQDDVYDFPTLMDRLKDAKISWKYYDQKKNPKKHSLWNPLPGFKSIREDPEQMKRLVPLSQYFDDIKAGELPEVSWIVPIGPDSEHPPADSARGMWHVTELVNAVMESKYWKDTVIIITWDDYGGFYDHVPPPKKDKFGYGPRVPTLIISPYSKPGSVCHSVFDFTSPLKLIEKRFALTCLTERDCESNDMLDCFDFKQKPLETAVITKDTKLDFSNIKPTRP
jgi:phospholipase C